MAMALTPVGGAVHRDDAVESAPQAARHRAPSRRRRGLRRVTSAASTLVLALAALAFLLLAVGPHVFGYRTATMLTGSMSPLINPGDVVVSVAKPASLIAVADT